MIVFMVWTFSILMRQKKTWALYAKKKKLRYTSNALFDSPSISGVMGDHAVSLFASEHFSEDARGSRKLTAIEVNLNSVMPVGGGIASGGMIPILKTVQFKTEFLPKYKKWKKSYIACSDNKSIASEYLNDERARALCDLMKIENSWVILIFKDDAMLLRVDTPEPLHDPKELDKIIKKMVAVAEVLELKKGELKRLKSVEVKSASQGIELEVDDEELDAPSALSLEDDVSEKEVETEEPQEAESSPSKENADDKQSSASSKTSKKKK